MMMGEKQIVGNKYVKISKENKVRLPAFTGAEVGEEVIVTFMPIQKKLVVGTSAVEDKMYELFNKIISLENCTAVEKRRLLRSIFGTLTYEIKLNSEKQIKIPKKALESEMFKEKVYIVGKEDYIEIYPSEEEYQLSLKNI